MRPILNAIADNSRLAQGLALPLMEHFYTIQGEGRHAGKPAYFIRIGGCDVGCHWCDVKESWDPSIHPLTDVDEIGEIVRASGVRHVVVTGGEPGLFNLTILTQTLQLIGCTLYLETSGAYPLTGEWDWICLSPKKTSAPTDENLMLANELKVIVHNQSDFKWASDHAQKVNEACLLYLQPEWSKSQVIMPQLVDYVLANPQWMVSLQTHKYMHIP